MAAVETLQAKAHQLIGQLNPGKLAAVVHLLERECPPSPDMVRRFERARKASRRKSA
jgi:hypothetical protein